MYKRDGSDMIKIVLGVRSCQNLPFLQLQPLQSLGSSPAGDGGGMARGTSVTRKALSMF